MFANFKILKCWYFDFVLSSIFSILLNFPPVLSDFLKPRKANRRIMVFEIYENSFINLSSLRDYLIP